MGECYIGLRVAVIQNWDVAAASKYRDDNHQRVSILGGAHEEEAAEEQQDEGFPGKVCVCALRNDAISTVDFDLELHAVRSNAAKT